MDFKKQTYSTQVGQFIRTLIQSSVLKPGDQIKEVELAKELGISRAPIREALQVLVQDGLITSEPQKGKSVKLLSPKEVIYGYEVSGILEGAGIASSIDMWTEEDFADLQDLVDIMEIKCKRGNNLECLSDLDDKFHTTILQHCDNLQLITAARLASSNISKFLCYNYWITAFSPKQFYERHRKVFDILLTKNKVDIEIALREHYAEVATPIANAIKVTLDLENSF